MRPTGVAKAGFYPIPLSVLKLVIAHLTGHSAGLRRLLDPCCGQGEAAAMLASTYGLTSFGIELHADRANASRQCLTQCLRSDALAAHIQRDSFSVLLLNPPYDTEGFRSRSEDVWLQRMTGTLQTQGVLIFVISEARCTPKLKQYLYNHYRRLSFLRFPAKEYKAFQQIIILGAKGQPNLTRVELDHLAHQPITFHPLGKPTTGTLYPLPLAKETSDILFYSDWIAPEEQLKECRMVGIWQDPAVKDALHFKAQTTRKPLMTVRKGHLVRMIAAGLLNNSVIQQDTKRWAIKGATTKVTVPLPSIQEEYTSSKGTETRTVERNIERFVPTVEAWDLTPGPMFGAHIIVECGT